ncbi:MAG: alpha/beta fold hydrolase [Actinomycetota bacterium]
MKLGYVQAGAGPVLLLVHGFPLDRRIWSGQLGGLSDKRQVVTPDLRGRGLSPAPGQVPWSIDTHAADLADTIEFLQCAPVDLAGLSMGGYVAFALMRSRPELIRSLVLVSTRAAEDPPEYKTGREMTAERAERFGTRALAESMIEKLLAPSTSEQVRQAVLAMMDSVPGITSANDSLAMRDRADATSMLGSIAVPVLVVEGTQEALLPAGTAQAMASAIPGARLASIPAAGHFAPIENPAGFNEAVQEFLAPAGR